MTEAAKTLSRQGPTFIWARQLAFREVKQRWQAQGIKTQYAEACELRKAAETYFNDHLAELLDQAWEWSNSYKTEHSSIHKPNNTRPTQR